MGGKRGDVMCPLCEAEKETFNITYWDMNVCVPSQHAQSCVIINCRGGDKILSDRLCRVFEEDDETCNITQHRSI